jgi:hypothetical protein
MQQKDDIDKNEISPRMRALLEKGRAEAHKHVVERGIAQFRVDPETMDQLLKLSDHRGIPLGTMLREWVKERLRSEQSKTKQASNADYRALCLELKDELAKLRADVFKKYS